MNNIFKPTLDIIEQELNQILPIIDETLQNNTDWLSKTFDSSSYALKMDYAMPLIKPTRSLVDLGGKRWRPLLLVLSAQAQLNTQSLKSKEILRALHLTPLVEFIHTASLLHDDIEDSSDTRRGKPAAYITYGTDTTINAASWLYFTAPLCIDTLEADIETKNKLYSLYNAEARKLHLGQAMDIAWHRDKDFFPQVQDYETMVMCKTGTLASLAIKAGLICANASQDTINEAGKLASQIGAGFQIIDDVINLTIGNPGKKRGDDIVEGKKSLPVLIFASKSTASCVQKLQQCFLMARQEGINSTAVEDAISLLQSSDSIKCAKARGKQLITESCSKLKKLFAEDNVAADSIELLFTSMIPKELKEEAND